MGLNLESQGTSQGGLKVIFCDIDGVLVTANHLADLQEKNLPLRDFYGMVFDPKCVALLNLVVGATGAKIVISSAWRVGVTQQRFREMWEQRGMRGEIIGFTPIFETMRRGDEIQRWLDETTMRGLTIDSFVVLDDVLEVLDGIDRGHVVITSWSEGLTLNSAVDIFQLLRNSNGTPPESNCGLAYARA